MAGNSKKENIKKRNHFNLKLIIEIIKIKILTIINRIGIIFPDLEAVNRDLDLEINYKITLNQIIRGMTGKVKSMIGVMQINLIIRKKIIIIMIIIIKNGIIITIIKITKGLNKVMIIIIKNLIIKNIKNLIVKIKIVDN